MHSKKARTTSVLFVATSMHTERFLSHSVHSVNSHSVIQQMRIELA